MSLKSELCLHDPGVGVVLVGLGVVTFVHHDQGRVGDPEKRVGQQVQENLKKFLVNQSYLVLILYSFMLVT